MPEKPSFVFVPGGWHRPSTWSKLIPPLEAQQHRCVAVSLPTVSPDASKTFPEDIKEVRNAILAETSVGRDVIVVTHSYGGVVGASAIKGLTKNDTAGPAVVGIIYIASCFIPTGQCFMAVLGNKPVDWWVEKNGFAVVTKDPQELFYHDLPEEEAKYWVSELEQLSIKPLKEDGEHAYAGWKDVPSWYAACLEDKVMPVEVQRMFVQQAKDEGADVTLREIQSSHSPMLSKPEETVGIISEAAKAFVG